MVPLGRLVMQPTFYFQIIGYLLRLLTWRFVIFLSLSFRVSGFTIFFFPLRSQSCETPWSVFQDGTIIVILCTGISLFIWRTWGLLFMVFSYSINPYSINNLQKLRLYFFTFTCWNWVVFLTRFINWLIM